jgi:hypothetical protein
VPWPGTLARRRAVYVVRLNVLGYQLFVNSFSATRRYPCFHADQRRYSYPAAAGVRPRFGRGSVVALARLVCHVSTPSDAARAWLACVRLLVGCRADQWGGLSIERTGVPGPPGPRAVI